jgi:hypothetical protein
MRTLKGQAFVKQGCEEKGWGRGDLMATPDGRCWEWPHVLQRWTRQKPPGETAWGPG